MKPRPEEFDRIVQQHLRDSGQDAGDWDMPSAGVWDAVAVRIKPEKKRRWGFWWVLGGAGLVIIVSLWILLPKEYARDKSEMTPEQATQALHKEGITDSGTQMSEQVVPDLDVTEDPSQTQSALIAEKGIQAARNTYTSGTQVNHPVATQATNPAVLQHAASVPSPPTGNSVEIIGPSESTDVLSMASSPVQANEVRIPLDVQFLNSPIVYLDRAETPLLAEARVPMISRPRQPCAWSLAAFLSPSLGTRRITVPSAQPRVKRNLLLQQEEPAMQLGFGISALHDFSARWSFSAGVEYGSYLLNSSSTHQIRYTRAGEMPNAHGNFENRFHLNLQTSYGELNTEVVLERSSDAQIEENRFIDLKVETSHSLQELRFPLSVRYQIPVGTWRMSCYAGLSANVLLENQLTFRAVQPLNSEILQTRTLRKARMSGSRDMTAGYHFGIDMEMPLDRQWSVMIGPSMSGSIQPVYQNRQVMIYPVMIDMDLGVRYRF